MRLQRDGEAPLRFAGCLIARQDASAPQGFLAHDLALYHVADGGFAVEIVARQAGAARPARCHARLAGTLDEALTQLETHDPARDICPGLAAPDVVLDNEAVSPAALLINAAALHAFRQDVVRRYRIGVGAFLAGLAGLHI